MGDRAAVYGRQSSNKAKSISEQLELGHKTIAGEGWTHAADYQDGRSASRFGTKVRGGWDSCMSDVDTQVFDILILWESSRGDRTPESWFAFLSSCRKNSVSIHVITHDRTYDLSNARDWKTLAEDGVNNAYESELLSIRTKRGHAGAAAAGLPPGGPTPFGYRRTFDPHTGKRIGQVIDLTESQVVIDIFKSVSRGEPLTAIANRLNATESPQRVWTPSGIRNIIRNRSYVALRVLHGIESKGTWEPIVDDRTFYAALKVISDPSRTKTRPGRQKHLLTFLGRCAVCETYLDFAAGYYRCSSAHHCVSMPKDVADQAMSRFVIGRLLQPDALKALQANDNGDAQRAEGLAAKLRADLDRWRDSAIKGETTPESLAVIEAGLQEQIKEADQRVLTNQVPLVLREMLDGHDDHAGIETRWNDATVIARRQVIKALCEVKVARGQAGGKRSTFTRLGPSRWHGDDLTWAELWA